MKLKYILLVSVLLGIALIVVLFIRSEGFQDDFQKMKKTFVNEFVHKLSHAHNITSIDGEFRKQTVVFQKQGILKEYDPKKSWRRDSEVDLYSTKPRSGYRHKDYNSAHTITKGKAPPKSHIETSESTKSSIPLPCEKQRDIYVAFIDEGFELDHPNLKDSTDSSLSYDFIYNRTNVLPVPYDPDMKYTYPDLYLESSHGTMCMGRVGSKAGHGCDEGVAPHVKLVGLKAIRFGGKLVDKKEARALSYRHDIIDVFACCYGAKENVGFFGPRKLTKIALLDGATKVTFRGRLRCSLDDINMRPYRCSVQVDFDIKTCNIAPSKSSVQSKNCQGVIFVYPSGNGHFDNCNADGYANSVDTVTIATVNRKGHVRKNGEICSAALAAAVGKGYNTTILNSLCSNKFAGTSAACAVTAGFVGELRIIRPCLSKRDVEHIIVKTAIPRHGQQWRKNGAGLMFNDIIGFGQLDFEKMKEAAKAWSHVPKRNVCVINHPDKSYRRINGFHWNHPTELYSDACRGKHEVNYLEHVQVHIELNCDQLSQVSIQLISPAKTVSNLLTKINMTKEVEQKHRNLSWTFMSVNFWNEPAVGKWTVAVIVDNAKRKVSCEYRVKTLTLYGTVTYPYSGANQPITCQEDKNSSTLVLPSNFVQLALFLVYIIYIWL